jgi:hypothetical protein
MTKLTPEQVRFIDNYLYNSGVVYIDIRYEMTDHVATALEEMEGNFSENFRSYMAAHKAKLLTSNAKFKNAATKRALKLFMVNFIKPQFLCVAATVFLLAFWFGNEDGYEEVITGFMILHVIISVLVFITPIVFWLASEKKYSVVDKLTGICYLFPIFFRLDRVITNQAALLLFNVAYTSFMLLLVFTIFQIHKKYRTLYHPI